MVAMNEPEDIDAFDDSEPFERVPDPDNLAYEQQLEDNAAFMKQMRSIVDEARKENAARGGVFGHGYSPEELAQAKERVDKRMIRYLGGFERG